MKCKNHDKAEGDSYDVDRVEFGLEDAERDVEDEQTVGDIDKHVERFPNGRTEVGEPEVVTGGRHQQQDDQREEAEWLERGGGELAGDWCGGKNAQDWVGISASVIGEHNERGMDECQEAHHDT